MSHRKQILLTCVSFLCAPPLWAQPAVSAEPVDFAHDVVPILKQHCAECHGGGEAKGGFSINTRETFLDGDMAVPGDVQGSWFLDLVESRDEDLQMPPKEKPRVSAEKVAVLRAWVSEGLKWDDGFSFAVDTYEPPLEPRRPELPAPVAGRTNPVDRLLDAWLAENHVPRPAPISDAQFLRRVHLDLIGLLPTPEVLQEFLADASPDKRVRMVRSLLEDDLAYAEHWLTFFNDLLRNDYSGTGFITGGRKQISTWLHEALVTNKPFDQMTRELIAPPTDASRGFIDGIKWRGEVSAGQTVEIQFAQNVAQAFLGINLKCASCHDSFIDRWKLDEAYGLAAIYAQRPLEIHRCDKPTGEMAEAAWLFPELGQIDPQAPREARLEQLAALMTHPDNGRFTRTIVNRLWQRLMGRGIVHPLDAMQTRPWNDELLDYLAVSLADHDYDLKHILELIATSQAYQSEVEVREAMTDGGAYVYAGPRARRMTAEQFLDAVWQITGAAPSEFDAPVFRSPAEPRSDGSSDGKLPTQPEPLAQWIWGDSAAGGAAPPAGETLVFRKTLTVQAPERGAVIITCDNEFTLYLNGRELAHGDDWTRLQAIPLQGKLKPGANEFVVVARNAGSGPNPAGLYFDARVFDAGAATNEAGPGAGGDSGLVALVSDGTWEWNPTLPKPREGRLGRIGGTWQPVTVVTPVSSWTEAINRQAPHLIAQAGHGQMPMVRASLLKSDFLMRSLGRPIRDQIVSMRPGELTTLEAIDLANGSRLAEALAVGARNLASRDELQSESGPAGLIRYVYYFALSRDPTPAELEILSEALGSEPERHAIEDMLWAVFMTPEFLLIR